MMAYVQSGGWDAYLIIRYIVRAEECGVYCSFGGCSSAAVDRLHWQICQQGAVEGV